MALTENISEAASTRGMGQSHAFLPDQTVQNRWLGLLFAGPALGLLVIAACLPPAQAGVGTHRALGLPECSWITSMNLPCPTCGMTTAFSHTVRGQWYEAFRAQPLGLVFCVVAAMAVIGGLWTASTGARLGHLVATAWNRWWAWGFIALALGAWAWKIAVHRGVI